LTKNLIKIRKDMKKIKEDDERSKKIALGIERRYKLQEKNAKT